MLDLDALRGSLSNAVGPRITGRVIGVTGMAIRVALPSARVGELLRIDRAGSPLLCQVVGFSEEAALAFPLGLVAGIALDDTVESLGGAHRIPVGPSLRGRVLSGLGEPIDGKGPLLGRFRSVDQSPPSPLSRRPIDQPFHTGVRLLDGLTTFGQGQRVGLFAGSGVGKSTLLGAIARGCEADVVVVALVGERGREVLEFIDSSLGSRGLARSVVVVATSDAPALERARSLEVATTIAEGFRDEGANVLLLVDSVTRYARALREIGLAAGEPPTRRGYPPSVFAALPRVLERTGQGGTGAITALYTVLVEGGDMEEPIADEVRGILDGHIVLDRAIAMRGRFPAIDPLASLSRVMPNVTTEAHRAASRRLCRVLSAHEAHRDLISMGAYSRGAAPDVDAYLGNERAIAAFLEQSSSEVAPFEGTLAALSRLTDALG